MYIVRNDLRPEVIKISVRMMERNGKTVYPFKIFNVRANMLQNFAFIHPSFFVHFFTPVNQKKS